MRLDFTLNIPTIVSVLGTISAVCAWGIGIYSELDKRQIRTDIAVADIRMRLDKVEGNARDTTIQLRADMKADIGEIKGMLNQIIFNGTPVQRNQHSTREQLNEWRK